MRGRGEAGSSPPSPPTPWQPPRRWAGGVVPSHDGGRGSHDGTARSSTSATARRPRRSTRRCGTTTSSLPPTARGGGLLGGEPRLRCPRDPRDRLPPPRRLRVAGVAPAPGPRRGKRGHAPPERHRRRSGVNGDPDLRLPTSTMRRVLGGERGKRGADPPSLQVVASGERARETIGQGAPQVCANGRGRGRHNVGRTRLLWPSSVVAGAFGGEREERLRELGRGPNFGPTIRALGLYVRGHFARNKNVLRMVHEGGLEPPSLAAPEPKPGAYASSATRARGRG